MFFLIVLVMLRHGAAIHPIIVVQPCELPKCNTSNTNHASVMLVASCLEGDMDSRSKVLKDRRLLYMTVAQDWEYQHVGI